jgi:dTDP-4-dehydrorhamnose reductase
MEGPARFPSGIYHLCHDGETTWHDFAQAIFDQALALGVPLKIKRVESIRTEEYPTPARRPRNSCLDTKFAARTFGVRLPDWRVGLRDCMARKFAR